MADSFNLLRRVRSLDIAPELTGYSGVVIYAGQDDDGNNIEYLAGDQTGTVLEITNEWGSQAQADAIYNKICGYKYQPYKAGGTRIDPSAEIGDAVTVSDVYGGVFSRATTYGRHIISNLEAPSKEEVEHEFQIQSPSNRQYERFTRTVRASLSITAAKIAAEVEDRITENNILRATLSQQADMIEAKVSKEGGDPASFSWKLLSTMFSVSGKNEEKFRVDEDGAFVNGIIRATGGKIGGFDIQANYLSYNGQTWGGTNSTGIYAGPSGIQCGPAETGVRITSTGNLYAENGYFRGSVNAGNIQYGGNAGYLSGSGLASHSVYGSQIGYNTISTSYTSGGINTSLGYADFANGVFNGWNRARQIACDQLSSSEILLDGKKLGMSTINYVDYNGKSRSINVVTWSTR